MLCVDGGACGQAARMLEIGWGFAGCMCVPFFFFFFCCGSHVYLKLTEEYCSCVVKNLNTHVEIMKLYRYIVCLFISIYNVVINYV